MLKQIKKRIKAWKCLYTKGCKNVDENSSWRDILIEQEYYRYSNYLTSGRHKLWKAIEAIGTFSQEEQEYLEVLPAYATVRLYLKYDDYREDFSDIIDDTEVFSMCLPQNSEIPLREYTIVTDREDLWDLEIYIFKNSPHFGYERHGIIRYAKEPPADYVKQG